MSLFRREPKREMVYNYHSEEEVGNDPECRHEWVEDLPWKHQWFESGATRCLRCGYIRKWWTEIEFRVVA